MPIHSVAFLTCAELPEVNDDDQLVADELKRRNIETHAKVWDETSIAELKQFDAVLFRSTWDYHLKSERFDRWLKEAEENKIPVVNPIALVRWNSTKRYLQKLNEVSQVPIIPTLWIPASSTDVMGQVEELPWDRIVIKPEISASANSTYLTRRKDARSLSDEISRIHLRADVMVQPYCESVAEGEHSLMFWKGKGKVEFSHAALKIPQKGEFRIHVEYGGISRSIEPTAEYLRIARHALESVPFDWVYVRVDMLEFEGTPRIAEMEFIEPFLFFGMNEHAPSGFVSALLSYLS
jgi:glutathione synthase/RimK-type ligase-like ATP-grasp enzyme